MRRAIKPIARSPSTVPEATAGSGALVMLNSIVLPPKAPKLLPVTDPVNRIEVLPNDVSANEPEIRDPEL